MQLGLVGQAAGMFAVTNIDDVLVLALFFGQLAGVRGATARIALGQYLGFGAILAVSVAGAFGASFLPTELIPYLGLLPLLLGLRALWRLCRQRRGGLTEDEESEEAAGHGVLSIAAITLANGGDNVGVYVPVFAVVGASGQIVFVTVFLLLVAVWVAVGRFLATRPPIARVLARWGHIVLPIVLIGIGLVILIEGGALGL